MSTLRCSGYGPRAARLMAAPTGLRVEMCWWPCLRPSTRRAPSLPSLPFPSGGRGRPTEDHHRRGKAEEAWLLRVWRAPGQSRVVLAEATGSSHHILVTVLTIGILLPEHRAPYPSTQPVRPGNAKPECEFLYKWGIWPTIPHWPRTNSASYPGAISQLGMLRPITPQRFQALTVQLATANPQSPVGCTPAGLPD